VDLSSSWLSHFADAVGSPTAVQALTSNTWRVTVDGQPLVAKVGPGVADEAMGLRRLAGMAGGPSVPEVVHVDADLLVTTWVEQGPRSATAEQELGRALAALHDAPCKLWGGGSSWIGTCPVDPAEAPTAAGFYHARLAQLADRCGLAGPIDGVVNRLEQLIPAGPASIVHGDLWWGNVLWGANGRPWLIDPSVHGGHPEEDLSMLALFGAVPQRLLDAYVEVRPLGHGWQERVALFQLYPLLVHAVLFGGAYRAQAASIAHRYA
jgi:fructosamine-3-kinase